MRSKSMMREHCTVVRTRSIARDAAWVLLAIAALIALLAWGHAVDSDAQSADAFDAGVIQGRLQMADTVGDAYRLGLAHGLVQGAPCSLDPRLVRDASLRGAHRAAVCQWQQP